jgi:hypothetical protein
MFFQIKWLKCFLTREDRNCVNPLVVQPFYTFRGQVIWSFGVKSYIVAPSLCVVLWR